MSTATNSTPDQVIAALRGLADPQNLTWDQIMQIIADYVGAGNSTTLSVEGDTLPEATTRAPAPSSPGTNGINVWFTPPSPLTGTWRFYCNGSLKRVVTDYNMASVDELGAHTGDIIQICRVVDGVIGWWNRIVMQ